MKKFYPLYFTVLFLFTALTCQSQIVINEVYGGGGNSGSTYKNDFIELYNNSNTAIDISGWSVQYASATGTSWQVTALSGVISPNGYYLIQQAAGTGGTTNLPTPNATGNIPMAAAAGKVALVTNTTALSGACPTTTNIKDLVGFGSANCFEGTGSTPAPSAANSVQRTPVGFDSNQNASDFKVSAPTPIPSNVADTTPPAIINLSPANNTSNVATTVTASIFFSETIKKGFGTITIKYAANDILVGSLDVTANNITVSDKTVTFPIPKLAANSSYYIEISNGAFKDTSNNNFVGITGNPTWTFTTGNLLYSAAFNICTTAPTEGFTTYSVTGSENWGCTNFGRDAANLPSGSAANGVQINGFSNNTNVSNEDWLISPSFDLTATTYPLLSYWSRTAFNGAPLKLKVSTNFSGSGDPKSATWTDINGRFPNQASDIWTVSSQVNLAAFKQPNVYFAFVYSSTDEEGARWTLDDISLENSQTPPPATLSQSTTDIQFGFAAAGSNLVKTFTIIGNDITTDISISSTPNFEISLDGINYSSTVVISQAAANNTVKTLYTRFTAPVNDQNFSGNVTISTSSLSSVINLTATSIDPTKTLEVVNWNIEWFGSTKAGPTNETQQEQNVKTILQNIGADIYALAEVVDTARLGNIVRSLPGYSYVVSNYGSHTNTSVTGDGPLSEAQKLGFVYKTNMFSNINTTPLLNLTANSPEDAASANYNNWSSGRYPFMMSADVTLGDVTKNIKFILVHAKANTSPTNTAYSRRRAGVDSLYKLLNSNYSDDNIIILGDFNDDLDQTITSGITPPTTSYITFVNDSVNYPAVTLPLSRAGKKSTVSYNDVIDHVIVSNDMKHYYMTGSANILTDVTSLVSNYGSTTTDHYPVFSRYAFDAIVLPLKWLKFSAFKNEHGVELKWKTSQELNAKEFIIERSKDGIKYEAIAKKTAAGSALSINTYSFTDSRPFENDNFYRIKQIDRDGKNSTSSVQRVRFSTPVKIEVSPNPAKDFINITFNKPTTSCAIQLIDVNGRMVKQLNAIAGLSQLQLSMAGLQQGVYLLKIVNDKDVVIEKIVKE